MTRLLLCDDHATFRQGLRSILEAENGHRGSGIFSKLRLNDRARGAVYALREGIASLGDQDT